MTTWTTWPEERPHVCYFSVALLFLALVNKSRLEERELDLEGGAWSPKHCCCQGCLRVLKLMSGMPYAVF